MHESLTKQDRNNINDPQKKHRLELSVKFRIFRILNFHSSSSVYVTGRSNSPSEDSGGTGDELQSGKKKRRSFRKKIHSPDSDISPLYVTGRSNSPSEDSGGTGDELQSGKKKRRSFRKKIHSPDSVSGPGTNSANYSDSDIVSSPGKLS